MNECLLWAVLQAALPVQPDCGGWTNRRKSFYSIEGPTYPSPTADFHTMLAPSYKRKQSFSLQPRICSAGVSILKYEHKVKSKRLIARSTKSECAIFFPAASTGNDTTGWSCRPEPPR